MTGAGIWCTSDSISYPSYPSWRPSKSQAGVPANIFVLVASNIQPDHCFHWAGQSKPRQIISRDAHSLKGCCAENSQTDMASKPGMKLIQDQQKKEPYRGHIHHIPKSGGGNPSPFPSPNNFQNGGHTLRGIHRHCYTRPAQQNSRGDTKQIWWQESSPWNQWSSTESFLVIQWFYNILHWTCMLQLLHHISRQFRGSNDFKRKNTVTAPENLHLHSRLWHNAAPCGHPPWCQCPPPRRRASSGGRRNGNPQAKPRWKSEFGNPQITSKQAWYNLI